MSESPFLLHVTPYTDRLKGFFKEGLCENFGSGKPHALQLTLHEDRARLIDFFTWRRKGGRSHAAHAIGAEPGPIRDALSVAAFDIADAGGFIGALPRGRFSLPTYYFMTDAIVVFEHGAFKSQPNDRPVKPRDLGDLLYTAQSGGTSAHAGLKAVQQIETLLKTISPQELDFTSDEAA